MVFCENEDILYFSPRSDLPIKHLHFYAIEPRCNNIQQIEKHNFFLHTSIKYSDPSYLVNSPSLFSNPPNTPLAPRYTPLRPLFPFPKLSTRLHLQIMGRPFGEAAVLRVAHALERHFDFASLVPERVRQAR